jgi:hypothetical protein
LGRAEKAQAIKGDATRPDRRIQQLPDVIHHQQKKVRIAV